MWYISAGILWKSWNLLKLLCMLFLVEVMLIWDVKLPSLIDTHWQFEGTCFLRFYPEGRRKKGSRFHNTLFSLQHFR